MIYRLIARADTSKAVIRAVYFDGTNHAEVLAILNEVNASEVVVLTFPEPTVLRYVLNATDAEVTDLYPGDWLDSTTGQKATEAEIRATYYLADAELAP
jgi:hypothetical protein